MVETYTGSVELLDRPPKVAYVFPGQGSQYKGMGEQLVKESEIASDIFQRADRHIGNSLGYSVSQICFENPHEVLDLTRYAQPAIYTHSVAMLMAMKEAGMNPDIVAGHSMGEIPAYIGAGGLSFEEGLDIVIERGRLMERAGEMMDQPGGMGAILGMQEFEVQRFIDNEDVYIANVNAPDEIVISGVQHKIEQVIQHIQESARKDQRRVFAKQLRVSIPAHSPFMEPIVEEFREFLLQFDFKTPTIPIILNRTNDLSCDPDEIRKSFSDQLTRGVHWVNMQKRLEELGVGGLIEVGPGSVLSRLAGKSYLQSAQESILASDKIQDFGALLYAIRTNYHP